MLQSVTNVPVARHSSRPFDIPKSFISDVRVEALGDGVGDGGGAVLAQGGDELFLLADQRIDLGGFAVEEPAMCCCSSRGGSAIGSSPSVVGRSIWSWSDRTRQRAAISVPRTALDRIR